MGGSFLKIGPLKTAAKKLSHGRTWLTRGDVWGLGGRGRRCLTYIIRQLPTVSTLFIHSLIHSVIDPFIHPSNVLHTYYVSGTVLSFEVQRLKNKSKTKNQTIPTLKELAQLKRPLSAYAPQVKFSFCLTKVKGAVMPRTNVGLVQGPKTTGPPLWGLLGLLSVPQEVLSPNALGLPLKYSNTGQFWSEFLN